MPFKTGGENRKRCGRSEGRKVVWWCERGTFVRLVGAKTQKGPGDLNDRLTQWLMLLATYMFACPDALNDLFTSFRVWGSGFHTYGKFCSGYR